MLGVLGGFLFMLEWIVRKQWLFGILQLTLNLVVFFMTIISVVFSHNESFMRLFLSALLVGFRLFVFVFVQRFQWMQILQKHFLLCMWNKE